MFLERCPAEMREHLMIESWTDPDSPDNLSKKAEALTKQLKCKRPVVESVEKLSETQSVESVRQDTRQSKNSGGKNQKNKAGKKAFDRIDKVFFHLS